MAVSAGCNRGTETNTPATDSLKPAAVATAPADRKYLLERVDVTTAEGSQTAWVIATNVYFKSAQGWRLVAHHASPGTSREVSEIVEAPSALH